MTIKDLAAQTGYSVGTISRVLNNQPNVSARAREVILKAARDSGFQLNANAKQLKQQHSTSILVVAKGRTNELYSRLVETMQTRTAESTYPLVVDYVDEIENEVLRAVQLCREKKPMGILFLGGSRKNFLADFHQITIPCVLVTGSAEGLDFPNLSSVSSDDMLAARMAIDHLVSLGHRRFAVIGGHREFSDITQLRYQGCMQAFREYGIAFDEELDYETVFFSYGQGYKAARNLLDRGRDFTALFAMSDVMALGAIRALKDAGKRVPEDVAVMGLDGLNIGEYTVPRLATVAQNVQQLADRSLHLLLGSIGGKSAVSFETVPVTLLPRESAGEKK